MVQETKREKESKAVTTRKPAEVVSRWEDMDRWFDRMFEDFWRRPLPSLFRTERWWPTMSLRMPALDVYEEKDDVVVKAELPGLSRENIEVQVADNVLTIKGEKKKDEEVKEEEYYRCERSFGAFSRSVQLPAEVKPDQVKATFKNGILEVRLPKTEEARRKAITVKID